MDWITTSTILSELCDFNKSQVWEVFVHRFREPIVRFGLTLGLQRDAAEEVAQETLLAFAEQYRNGQYDRTRGRLSKWLFGIAYRQAMRQRAAAARHIRDGGTGELVGDIADDEQAQQRWESEWEQAMLQQCIKRVRREVEPDTFRAFELAMVEGRSAAQAADMLGVNVKLIYNAKHRVLKRIRELRAELEDVSS